MKGLLIAYNFHPVNSVGALRPSYWAQESVHYSDFSLDVITATEGKSEGYRRFYVPLKSSSIWSFAIRDEGLRWSKDLREWLRTFDTSEYNFVIFSGGPFFHFHTAKYFKKLGLSVYFDFRDPFSYNPRFKDGFVKKTIKRTYERRCLRHSDAVITVNDACHKYIGSGMKLKRWIIPNGYDERALPDAKQETVKGTLFYGGKFYWSPTFFFQALEKTKTTLFHAGPAPTFAKKVLPENGYIALGMLTQKELFEKLQTCEIGLVFTMDVPFESTTKIYDYMALGKKILVVTQGEPNVGVLNRELKNYPNYRWVRNDAEEIEDAINSLLAERSKPFDATSFSRKQGLSMLIQNITDDAS